MRPRDLSPAGVPVLVLFELVKRGEVEQVGRGHYALPGQSDHALSGDDSFVNSPANNSAHSVGTRLKNSHHMIPILRLL